MSNLNEINFYKTTCPEILRGFVPDYKNEFYLEPGRDVVDLEEEFDISRYCPTASVASFDSVQSSLDSNQSLTDIQ